MGQFSQKSSTLKLYFKGKIKQCLILLLDLLGQFSYLWLVLYDPLFSVSSTTVYYIYWFSTGPQQGGEKQTHTTVRKTGRNSALPLSISSDSAFDQTTAGSYYSTAAQWMGKPVSMVTVKALDVPRPAQSGEQLATDIWSVWISLQGNQLISSDSNYRNILLHLILW